MQILIGLAGIVVILAVALLFSTNRRGIRLRVVGPAFLLQAAIAAFVLYVPAGQAAIGATARGVERVLGYSRAGIEMVFGGLTNVNGMASLAINVLPIIIFFSALVSVLYFFGIMQLVVRFLGGFLQRVLGVDKVEGLYAAANILVGQSESPLVIRGYLKGLTKPQVFALMVTGMAGVAGSILAAYAQMGVAIEYLLAAAFMSAPGGLLMAKILMPDDPVEAAAAADAMADAVEEEAEERPANLIMAIFNGAEDGVKLAVAVGAMLVVFVAFIAMLNGMLGGIAGLFGYPDLTFQKVLGLVFAPLMFLLNVPWAEAERAGELFGQKVILNEFVAYLDFGATKDALSPHTQAVVTFALCGFANISSIAIQMGVLGGLAPDKRPMIAQMGLRAVLGGSLANLMSAAMAGLILVVAGV
ncbi:MAG: nucleoside transporter C-terminal domain-containing protein [Phenylobacterium sp.]|uniref:NupC/NupG family nucleoside CNT transporter n=1 Tax=Phenylobacterium sp. TaxID=1871053 RepID=UPI0027376C66|nr:nucleoside transporter C-terminal domain-containing protein [Phenylobacterium sp.]MDP3747086.1 nucleoside transporter C-terminal domain-containing protein [Phenylobacterium sp.]